jgi:hypothetical protein
MDGKAFAQVFTAVKNENCKLVRSVIAMLKFAQIFLIRLWLLLNQAKHEDLIRADSRKPQNQDCKFTPVS